MLKLMYTNQDYMPANQDLINHLSLKKNKKTWETSRKKTRKIRCTFVIYIYKNKTGKNISGALLSIFVYVKGTVEFIAPELINCETVNTYTG